MIIIHHLKARLKTKIQTLSILIFDVDIKPYTIINDFFFAINLFTSSALPEAKVIQKVYTKRRVVREDKLSAPETSDDLQEDGEESKVTGMCVTANCTC